MTTEASQAPETVVSQECEDNSSELWQKADINKALYNVAQVCWYKPAIHLSCCDQGFKVMSGYTESLRSAWIM